MTTNTEVTAKQLRDLAAKFRAIFEGYSGVADEMENANVASIEARGLPTLNVTITRALGNVNTMRRAILRAQVDAATQPVSESAPRPKKASEAKRKNT